MSLLLALDSVTHLCSCALYYDGSCLARQCDDLGKGHGEHLIGQIGSLLHQAGVDKNALGRIAVNIGPGSFTGMRVGVATARGLGLALGIAAIGVSRFAAMEYEVRRSSVKCQAKNQERFCAVVLPAMKDLLSFQIFDATGTPLAPPRQARAEEIAMQLRPPMILSGDGCPQIVSILDKSLSTNIEIHAISPEAELDAIAAIAMESPLPHPSPSPLYLRAADAKPAAQPLIAQRVS